MRRPKGNRDAFKNLLERYPDISDYILDLFYRARMQRLSMKDIHTLMLMALKAKGLGAGDYPFNVSSKGYYGLRLHLKKLSKRYKQGGFCALKKRR